MARSINRLSARTVETVTKPGRHGDGGNLFLIVDRPKPDAPPGAKPAKRWVFLYRWNKRLREMGLGSLNAVPLVRARELAAQARGLLAEGKDPIEIRRIEQAKDAGRTFGEGARQRHEAKEGAWKNDKYTTQWLTALETYAEPIWDKPVDAVAVADILAILQPIWTIKAETASRVRGRIEAVLDAARARGMIAHDRANPARWRGHLSHLLPKRQRLQRGHHAALPYVEIAAFMARLRQRQAIAGLCLEFTILTAARSGEALRAVWTEIDMAGEIWTVPKERMKASKEHRVPLSSRSMEILRELEQIKQTPDGFVFPGQKPGRPLSVMALEMLLRRMKVAVTVHGFRSTFRDWCGECTVFPREIAESALAHQVGNEVERAYRRADALEKRRQLMQAWADFCADAKVGNVVPIRGGTQKPG